MKLNIRAKRGAWNISLKLVAGGPEEGRGGWKNRRELIAGDPRLFRTREYQLHLK